MSEFGSNQNRPGQIHLAMTCYVRFEVTVTRCKLYIKGYSRNQQNAEINRHILQIVVINAIYDL